MSKSLDISQVLCLNSKSAEDSITSNQFCEEAIILLLFSMIIDSNAFVPMNSKQTGDTLVFVKIYSRGMQCNYTAFLGFFTP
jgi:hypothetical protein